MACVSKTEITDILKTKLPNDILSHLVKYHAHPIIEYIGLENLKKQYDNLSIAPHYVYWYKYQSRPIDKSTLKSKFEKSSYYYAQRKYNMSWTNYVMTANYTLDIIFYPINSQSRKNEILSYAKRNGIELKKSWTKSKMLDEFYKKIEM